VRAHTPVPAADVHRNTLLPGDDAIAHERAQTDRHQRAGKLCEYNIIRPWLWTGLQPLVVY